MASKLTPLSRVADRSASVSAASSRWAPPKWLKLRYIGTLAVLVWAVFYFFHTQYPELTKLQQQQQALQVKLAALQKQHGKLSNQVQELQSDTYIARYASQHFNLVLPGQVPFNVQH